MSSLQPKLAKGRKCRLHPGSGDMLERVKDCKLKRMSGLGVERRRVLARKQELNMLSRAYDTSKSTCSREHAES